MENVNSRVVYNKISDKLREEVRKALPKRGQTIWFKSVRPKGRGSTVLNTDRIFDPWARDLGNGKFEGEFIDIAYIVGQAPGKGDQFGRIQFTRGQGNVLPIKGGNLADERLFQYLFLCNSLKNNGKKVNGQYVCPWFVENSGRRFVCQMQEPAVSAKEKNDRRRKIRQAGEVIDLMGPVELFDFALGLDMKGINKFSDEEEVRARLGDIAEKDPDKILRLNSDIGVKLNIMIKNAEQFGVVTHNKGLGVYEWPDTGEVICMTPPGKGPREALTAYLLSDKGAETLRFIQGLVNAKKEEAKEEPKPEKPKTAPKEKKVVEKV